MNRNSLIILTAITLTVVLVAFVVVSQERSPTYMSQEALLPELADNINDANIITLVSNRDKTVLERSGEDWHIANSDHYPALFDKVRSLLIKLAQLQTKERKTSNPDLYHHLDVQDPSQKDSNSIRITITGSEGNVLADLIIGKPRISKVTNVQTGLYVRKPDAAHALLVEGNVQVSAAKTAWFNPDIVNIASERIREVIIRQPDGTVMRAFRNNPNGNFQIADLPEDREIQSITALNRFGSILQEITAHDARSLETFEFKPVTETTVYTFDGLVADIRSTRKVDRHYATFSFRFDKTMQADTAKAVTDEAGKKISVPKQVNQLQQRVDGWVYQIPGFKFDVITATLDDYTRKVASPGAIPDPSN